MESIDDIRQKRLQFFSKYIVGKNDGLKKTESVENQENKKIFNLPIEEKKVSASEPQTSVKLDLSSAQILTKIFDTSDSKQFKSLSQSAKINQSISLDETKNPFRNNRKLEEFKNIVETSYQNYVLNKSDNDQLISRRMSLQSANSYQAWNANLNSLEESFKNSSMNFPSAFAADSINVFPNEILNEEQKTENPNNPLLNCKIPYMSAYNIYENTKENESKVGLDKFFDAVQETKKLTSNGSSVNTSPTSLSSSGSIKKLNEGFIPKASLEIKPPETPKTSNLTFRKNLMRKSSQFNQTESNRNSLDLSSTTFQVPKVADKTPELALPLKKSNQLPSLKPAEKETLDLFFQSRPKNNERKNKKKNKKGQKKDKNIFNYLEDMVSEDEFLHDHSDDENTLDIFTSDDDSLEVPKNPKNLDLKIDLAQLNSSDDESRNKIDERNLNSDESDEEIVEKNETIRNTSSRQQIKPDIIPNLVLDQIDDDRSLSVAVSLAKSMCKEIDYQKEMEAIYNNHMNDKKTKKKTPLDKNSRKSVQLNELKLTGRLNKNTSDNLKQDVVRNSLNSSRKTVLKPPTSSRISSANNPSKPNLLRSKTVIGSHRERANELIDSLEPNVEIIELKNSKTQKNSLENLLIQSSEIKRVSSQNEINRQSRMIKNSPAQSRAPIWQSSMQKLKRPSSVCKSFNNPNDINTNLKNVQNVNSRPPSGGLFLTYSKLIEIESSIQKNENEPPRPKTAFSRIETITSTDNEKIDKQEVENLSNDYADNNETEFLKCQVDWLDLPHEIWLKVLKYLNHNDLIQIGRTCKTFYKLYTDNCLWRKIELKYKYNMKNEWLEWIGKRKPNELNIVQCSGNITLSGISEMFRNIGENLQKLNLSRCSNGSLSGDNFALQASIRCPNVTSLDLSWTLLSNQTLKLIVDSFRKIESINLSGCNMIQEDGFNQLLIKHGNHLRNLEISGCIHFSSDAILNIGAYCRDLERLNISNCHRVTNEVLIEASPHWLKMKFIDLRGIKNIKNNCVSTLVRRCPHLEGLLLGDCVHIGDSSILEISTYKPNTKYLDLNNCKKISDASIRSMAPVCSKLEFLNLKGTSITDTGLITLSNSKFIKTIEELNLSFLPISEFVLVKILKNAEKLKKIHLYGCYNIKHIEEIKNSIGSNINGKTLKINI